MFIQIQLFIEIKNHQMGVPRSVAFLNPASSSFCFYFVVTKIFC